jgi:hypothetical protein
VQRKQVEGMIDFFKLNIRHRLVGDRIGMAQDVVTLIDQQNYAQAGQQAIRYRPHSLLARQILIDRHQAQHLPVPEVEFEWLFSNIRRELELAMDILESHILSFNEYRPFNELIWSLAVLVADPRPGTPANLAQRLTQLGLFELVDNCLQEMALCP